MLFYEREGGRNVFRFYIPPYWALGYHLCRWGYNSLENMQAAFQRTVDLGIPLDAQWGDIDIMERCQRQEKFFRQILGHWTSLLTKRTLLVCLTL